jgi:hypothetical protein
MPLTGDLALAPRRPSDPHPGHQANTIPLIRHAWSLAEQEQARASNEAARGERS